MEVELGTSVEMKGQKSIDLIHSFNQRVTNIHNILFVHILQTIIHPYLDNSHETDGIGNVRRSGNTDS